MERLFVDTTALAALYDRSDRNHAPALRCWKRFRKEAVELWISDYILDETLTLIRMRVGHGEAVRLGESLMTSGINLLEVTPEVREAAWDIFVRYEDKDFSFTDCTSFALMREISVSRAFTFDRHFRQFGLDTVP